MNEGHICPHCGKDTRQAAGEETDWEGHQKAWNELADQYLRPRVLKFHPTRRRKLALRLREVPNFWTLVRQEFAKLGNFALTGNWLTLDWLLEPGNLAKLLEGNYREEKSPRRELDWAQITKEAEQAFG